MKKLMTVIMLGVINMSANAVENIDRTTALCEGSCATNPAILSIHTYTKDSSLGQAGGLQSDATFTNFPLLARPPVILEDATVNGTVSRIGNSGQNIGQMPGTYNGNLTFTNVYYNFEASIAAPTALTSIAFSNLNASVSFTRNGLLLTGTISINGEEPILFSQLQAEVKTMVIALLQDLTTSS